MRAAAHTRRATRLGANAELPILDYQDAAQRFELFARAADVRIGGYVLWWRSLASTIEANRPALERRFGAQVAAGTLTASDLAALSETIRLNAMWLERARLWGRAINALDKGTAELQPWQRPGESIRFAVVKSGGRLNFWPIVLQVISVAAGAVITGIGVYLTDAWIATQQTANDAELLRAKTLDALAKVAANDPQLATAIAQATGKANAASQDTSSWFDTLTGAAGSGIGGGLVALAVVYALSRGRR